jgi:hypothetical protein
MSQNTWTIAQTLPLRVYMTVESLVNTESLFILFAKCPLQSFHLVPFDMMIVKFK